MHTADGCLQTLDDVLALGSDALAGYDFACAVGDHSNHTCYTTVEAMDAIAARATLPPSVRAQAQVIEVGKFTPEQIRSFHG
jgi:2-keto-3-deoxy-L-rhamnonate aldolase RhmA